METLNNPAKELEEIWGSIFENGSNKALAEAHLPGFPIVQLNEVVAIACEWALKQRAPQGFAPAFNLGRAMAATALNAAIEAARSIKAGKGEYFVVLATNLNEALSALHTMTVFSNKGQTINADISAELTQAIALLNTGQRELADKVALLKQADESAQRISDAEESLAPTSKAITDALVVITNSQTEATAKLAAITALQNEVESLQEESEKVFESNKVLAGQLQSVVERAKAIEDENRKQTETIKKLLPGAGGAGLAHSFESRASGLEVTKWIWFGVFMATVGGLVWLAINGVLKEGTPHDIWFHLLARLPIAGPLVWLGYVAAVQYGNVIRVQEDYEFKKATSHAFEGYRDHLEALSDVDDGRGQKAVELLAIRTVEILAKDPLRNYAKTHRDAAPTQELIELMKQYFSREAPDQDETPARTAPPKK